MSTFTGVGPASALVGPRPKQPSYSLLNTPGVVVSRDPGRVLNGVNLLGYPSDTPSLWEPCLEGTFRVKADGEARPTARFDAFVVYLPITCSTLGLGTPDEFVEMANAVQEATVSFGVEEALAQGVDGSTNAFFGDTNLSILGGATETAVVAVSYLEDAIGATGRMGMLHLTPAVMAALGPLKLTDGYPVTENGTPVVSGGGYIGTDPALGSTPAAGQGWIFATGPVEVYLGPIVANDLNTYIDRELNTVTYRAEQYVLAVWDTALQSGVLVDWDP